MYSVFRKRNRNTEIYENVKETKSVKFHLLSYRQGPVDWHNECTVQLVVGQQSLIVACCKHKESDVVG